MLALLGSVIGGGLGYLGAREQANAQRDAAKMQAAGFNLYKPYLKQGLSGARGALSDVLAQGAYTGPTYAGPNRFQTQTTQNMGDIGLGLQGSGQAIVGQTGGFGTNAGTLYDQYQQMARAAQADRLANATSYAAANTDPLVDAAMRDDRRQLMEQTLPGINQAASASGNTNSSRAGMAEAIARRAYDDRRADVTADIQSQLIDRSLAQQAQQFRDQGSALSSAGQANAALMDAYRQGLQSIGQGANFGMDAGNTLQGYSQAQMNADMMDANRRRDFEMQQYERYMNNILGRAPNSPQNPVQVTASPMAGALGGAAAGYDFMSNFKNPFGSFGSFGNVVKGKG